MSQRVSCSNMINSQPLGSCYVHMQDPCSYCNDRQHHIRGLYSSQEKTQTSHRTGSASWRMLYSPLIIFPSAPSISMEVHLITLNFAQRLDKFFLSTLDNNDGQMVWNVFFFSFPAKVFWRNKWADGLIFEQMRISSIFAIRYALHLAMIRSAILSIKRNHLFEYTAQESN